MDRRWEIGEKFTEEDEEWVGGLKNDFKNPNNPKFRSLSDLFKKINHNVVKKMGKVV